MQGYSHSFFVVSKYLIKPLLRVSQGFWGTKEHWQNIKGEGETPMIVDVSLVARGLQVRNFLRMSNVDVIV